MTVKIPCETKIDILKKEIENLEKKLKKTEESLKISQKRYEIATNFSDVTVFDYNIKTKKILTQQEDFKTFGMPPVMENGVEEVIESGIIAERSKENLRELYRKIDEGAPTASTMIYATEKNGSERTLAIQMVTVFDKEGSAAYAVGVRKDITDSVRFQKEKKYGDLLTSNLTLIYEANITQNRIFKYDPEWRKEIGFFEQATFSQMVEFVSSQRIASEDAGVFLEKFSRESLLGAFEKGERILSLEYRKKMEDQNYRWFEVRANLVEDEITGDVNMRVYTMNIDNKKKNEIKMAAERKRYESAISKSLVVYAVNVSAGTMSLGCEELRDKYGVFFSENRLEEIVPFILRTIHPENRAQLADLLDRNKLLDCYWSGKTDLSCEYAQADAQGKYNWFRCSLQLFEDEKTEDILAYAYIEEISEEKEKQLLLLYQAQHDPLTGFYNKNASEEKIDEILSSEEGSIEGHVFFMIDLDRFKEINDRFGHAFGDTVLVETSEKIASLFRSDDILGRVGGDEFVVFMRNVKDKKIAFLKAQEICDNAKMFCTENCLESQLTVSVGISFFAEHGEDYHSLYTHSDAALYDAKKKGRNRFSLYDSSMSSLTSYQEKGI